MSGTDCKEMGIFVWGLGFFFFPTGRDDVQPAEAPVPQLLETRRVDSPQVTAE